MKKFTEHSKPFKVVEAFALQAIKVVDAVLLFTASFLWGVIGYFESKNYGVNRITASSFE